MWGHVAVAGPGPGGGLGASRLPPWGTVGRGRQPRRVAPAACGDFGVVRQLRRVAPAAWGGFGVGANRGLILFREVNDLIRTLETLAYFDRYFLRFYRMNPAILRFKGVDAPGLRFHSFTSQKSIRAQLVGVPLWHRNPASSSLDWGKRHRLSNARAYLRGCLHNSRYYVAEF